MRILHNGTVFDNQIGGADPRTRRSSVRFRSAGMPVDGRDAYSNDHVVGETVVQPWYNVTTGMTASGLNGEATFCEVAVRCDSPDPIMP